MKYKDIAQDIYRHYIEKDPEGHPFPRVVDLVKRYQSSSATVQKALDYLESQNFINKRSGKRTSIVREKKDLHITVLTDVAVISDRVRERLIDEFGDDYVTLNFQRMPQDHTTFMELVDGFQNARNVFILFSHYHFNFFKYGHLVDFSLYEGYHKLKGRFFTDFKNRINPVFLPYAFFTNNVIVNKRRAGKITNALCDYNYWLIKEREAAYEENGNFIYFPPIEALKDIKRILHFFLRDKALAFQPGYKKNKAYVKTFSTEEGKALLRLLLENQERYGSMKKKQETRNLANIFLGDDVTVYPFVGSWYEHDARQTGITIPHHVLTLHDLFGANYRDISLTGISALISERCGDYDKEIMWNIIQRFYQKDVYEEMIEYGFFPACYETHESFLPRYTLDKAFIPEDEVFYSHNRLFDVIAGSLYTLFRVVKTMNVANIDEYAKQFDETLNDPSFSKELMGF